MSMSVGDAVFWTRWKPSTGAKLGWRLTRYDSCDSCGVNTLMEFKSEKGRVVRFKTYDAAKKKADELNRALS